MRISRWLWSINTMGRELHLRHLPSGQNFKAIKKKLGHLVEEDVNPHKLVCNTQWTELDTLQYLRQTKVLIGDIVATLDGMDLSQSCHSEPLILEQEKLPLKHGHEIPGFPALLDKWSIHKFVLDLTRYNYVDSTVRLSDPIGLVSRLLADVLRPSNSLCAPHLTTDTINLGICYFCRINDIGMARQLLSNMYSSVTSPPNESTFHTFLEQQGSRINKSPYPTSNTDGPHPLLMLLATLKEMNRRSLRATAQTWNLVLRGMPMGFGKSFILEEMTKRGIVPDGRSSAMCLELIANKDLDGAVEHALGLGAKMPTEMLEMLIFKLLTKKKPDSVNILQAIKLLQYSLCYLKVDGYNVSLLNTCLRAVKNRGKLNWQLGILGAFQEAGVVANEYSWEYLLESCLFIRESREKYALAGTILRRALDSGVLTRRSRIVARRFIRLSNTKGVPFRDAGQQKFEQLAATLSWKKDMLASKTGEQTSDIITAKVLESIDEAVEGDITEWPETSFSEVQDLNCIPRTDTKEARDLLQRELVAPLSSLREQLAALTASR